MQAALQATQNAQIAATQTREANPYPSNADWIPVERVFDGVTMLQVPVGCFMMGSTAEQVEAAFEQCETDLGEGECKREWYEDEQPLHEVCFNEPFWIDKYEVTQVQFARLGGTQANAPDVSGDNRPVDSITWFEASDFCETRGGRLPSEAEWEYAARGSDGLQYPWGNEFVPANAVWSDNSDQTADVGSKLAGVSWVGALDMSGNVWEWVADWYGTYPKGRQVEPTGPDSGEDRVLRGGSWTLNRTDTFRTSYRLRFDPQNWGNLKGFRCIRVR